MAWSIKTALACKQIDKVVVSTDSDKYAQLAKFYGAEVIMRPAELATDEAAMIPVLQHALKTYPADLIVLLDPTSPLRNVNDINQCLELIKQPETDSVITICEAEHNPFYVMGVIKDNYWLFPIAKPEKEIHRRQDAPKAYRVNAAVYVIKKEILMAGKIFTNKTRTVEMPQIRSSHIDSELDFKYIEFLLKEKYVKTDF